MTAQRNRMAVIGAGPIGLEAALYGTLAGLDVHVYERGAVGQNVLEWGHVRLFSPFGLNSSPWGRAALLASDHKTNLPAADELLTGRQYAERYLLPLSRLAALNGRVHEHVDVCAIGRSRSLKGDHIGDRRRGDEPFRLLLAGPSGEMAAEADWVLDCSGTFPNHNWVGAGGIPCVGERAAMRPEQYRLPDVLGTERPRFTGKRTLVVGSGYSAATAVVSLAELARSEPSTRAVWLTRTERSPPVDSIPDDPLPERRRLCETANCLALQSDGPVEWRGGRVIRQITVDPDADDCAYHIVTEQGCVALLDERADRLSNGGVGPGVRQAVEQQTEGLCVDRIIANVGYRPERRLYEELQVHECYASQGPMKLAAALLGETSADCLNQRGQGAETLVSPEPKFFILGSKSYGRDSRFLIKVGLEQIREVFSLMEGAKGLQGPRA